MITYRGVYQRDPVEARRYLIEHAMEEALRPSVKGVARLTFLNSADDAIDFIKQLPTKEARRAALDGIVNTNTEIFANTETSRIVPLCGHSGVGHKILAGRMADHHARVS